MPGDVGIRAGRACAALSTALPMNQRAWRLLTSLLLGPSAQRQVLSVAVHMGISAGALAELLTDQFANRPPVMQAPPLPAAVQSVPSSCRHADWVSGQIQALCNEPVHMHELRAALERTRRRSAPGADGITFQMMRNLADAEQERLLVCFNTIWST
ncbi:hypothetical protein MTO96_024565, partial [Rhipicephalus appendiculatus]